MSEVETSDPWFKPCGRVLARLLAIEAAMVCGVVLLGTAMVACFGSPADGPSRASGGTANTGDQPLETVAGIPPVAYLVARIGGPYVHVEVLVQPGQDPHIFEPTPRQNIRLSRARLFFRVGLPFEERLIERLAGRGANGRAIDVAAGIVRRKSTDEDDEGQADPHVWLSPPLLEVMVANIAEALAATDPGRADYYRANRKTLQSDLGLLDRRIAHSLSPYRGQAFYVFHPAFGYFAAHYGLRQESIEVEGKLPTPRQVFGLVRKAREDGVKIIFLQPQFNQQVAASIAQAIGGTVMPMDSLAGDVIANLNDVADKIAVSNRSKTL